MGAQAYGNAIEVSVSMNEDQRFYTVKFLLPDGQEHIAITRYSALRQWFEVSHCGILR